MSNKKSTKTHDIAIKVGEYEINGEKKGRYLNIGAMMDGENGPFLLLNAVNLPMEINYLANPKRQDKIIASCFEVKDRDENGGQRGGGSGGAKGRNITDKPDDRKTDFDDEIPF